MFNPRNYMEFPQFMPTSPQHIRVWIMIKMMVYDWWNFQIRGVWMPYPIIFLRDLKDEALGKCWLFLVVVHQYIQRRPTHALNVKTPHQAPLHGALHQIIYILWQCNLHRYYYFFKQSLRGNNIKLTFIISLPLFLMHVSKMVHHFGTNPVVNIRIN